MTDIVYELRRGLAIGIGIQSLTRETVSRAANEIETLRAQLKSAHALLDGLHSVPVDK